MDSQYGGIQWIQHNSSNHSSLVVVGGGGGGGGGSSVIGDMKTAGQLIIDPQPPCEEDLMASANSSSDYLATEDEADTANIDQIAAENLIFMARDGQMVAEIMTHNGTDENGAVVVTASDGEQIDCDAIMAQAALIQQHEDAGGGVYNCGQYPDTTPQMVTEEVITDDWVQHQGEERVEIPAEQLISNSQVLLDMEVPLPTIQDEYTTLRPYPCDFCSRRFRKKASLMNHMVAHQNDRPHLCKLCGSRFMRRQDLINHLKAHAEEAAAEPQIDDSDFIHFVNDTTPSSSQRASNDHYYEQDWSVPEDSVTIPTKSSRKHQQQQQITSITMNNHNNHNNNNNTPSSLMGNSSLSSSLSNTATTSITTALPRGRISRLKPKEDTYVVNVASNCDINSTSMSSSSYTIAHHCDTLTAPTATTTMTLGSSTQDTMPAAMQTLENHEQQQQQQQNRPELVARPYPIIDDNKPFVCQQCGLAFSREKAMLSHTKTHRNDSPYECPQCNELFWDQNSLQEHQRTHQFEESNSEYDPNEGEDETQSESESEQQLYGEFYCSECGMSFHRQDLLRRHSKTHGKNVSQSEPNHNVSNGVNNSKDNQQHCCNTCGETFAEALDLLAHAEIHARYPPFKCVLCGESFFEEPTIKKHLQSQHSHEITENSCILCGKECRDRKALIKHAWDHSREKCHSCSKCGKNFHNKARLKRHMASHRDKSVQCDVCHEEFPDGRTLSNHRHSHSTTSAGKLFPCHECGKTFGSRSSQQIHVRIHTGERPYGCRFCWKAFADGGTLRKHERIHTGEKPYACSVCPRAFNQRVVLREHIRSHHSGLDTKRGTYYCTVCGADLPSSGDLIQHLIQHSDMNTAMQRQPVTGPRKYKRRRKLKPHEIARLKRETKQNGGNSSDIDLSDFDMDNVDDLLAMTETNTSTENASSNHELQQQQQQQYLNHSGKTTKTKLLSSSDMVETNNNRYKSSASLSNSNKKRCSNVIMDHEDFDLDVGMDNEVEQEDHKKPRFNSTSSDKIWSTKASNEETYKSLLSNLETTLQSLDTLVVGPSTKSLEIRTETTATTNKRKSKHESTAQRTKQVQIVRSAKDSGRGGRKNKNDKSAAHKQFKGPQMIHTEKQSTSAGDGGNKKRSKSIVMRTQTNNIVMPKSVAIVDDYDIISPALHPPKQISCSPLHIKQEHDNLQILRNHHHHHTVSNSTTAHNRTQSNPNTTRHTNDLYDAHLLLEASGLRNDLDEILRSPLKSDKLNSRQRFTSESSTQFLAEQSVEEQHMIKIEPTSPDLREIVNGASSVNTSEVVNANSMVGLSVVGASHSRRITKSIRSQKSSGANRKYFEFSDDLNHIKTASSSSTVSNKRSSSHSSSSSASKSSKSARTQPAKSSQSSLQPTPTSYLDYAIVDTFNTASSSSPNPHANSFSSINAVVSAADATAAAASAAAAQQNPSPARKPQRYFECEMCSAVFFDRAQLLDHVPIHI